MKLALYTLNQLSDSMYLTTVKAFMATNCKLNHYLFWKSNTLVITE